MSNNKGNHIDFLFEEEHDEYTVPTIYNRLCKACLFAQTENTLFRLQIYLLPATSTYMRQHWFLENNYFFVNSPQNMKTNILWHDAQI